MRVTETNADHLSPSLSCVNSSFCWRTHVQSSALDSVYESIVQSIRFLYQCRMHRIWLHSIQQYTNSNVIEEFSAQVSKDFVTNCEKQMKEMTKCIHYTHSGGPHATMRASIDRCLN